MKKYLSSRQNFFLMHLGVSCLLALIVLIGIFFVWYPMPLGKAIGVTHIFLMMLVIDVIVGPILGLLVYKENKKSLKFDLTVIVLIQIFALCYGIYSIEQGRPAWLAYNVDRFELVRKNEIITTNIQNALPEYQQPSWFQPQYVAVEFSKNLKQRNDDMFAEALGGISLAQRPDRYVNFSKAKPQMQQRSQRLSILDEFNNKVDVREILEKYPQADSWLPLKANAVDMVVLLDKNAEVVKIVDLRPWN